MKYLYSFLLIILFLNISCNRAKNIQEVSENSDSLKIKTNRIVGTIGEILIPTAKKALSDWKEYKNVDEFMLKYYNISNAEALDYAEELSGLVQLMKDSIKIEKLKGLDVMARFNVLHNETLRLADMANIPSITNEEVKEEVVKIIEIYAAVNSKINTIYKAEALQNSLDVDTETPIEINEKPIIYRRENPNRRTKPLRERIDKPTISSKSTKQ
ncbi:hypothetical protein [Lutibacter sp.]